jgi:hypothetical protein
MIIKYLMIILITYNKVITCHMPQCYFIIWSCNPIILLYYINNMIKYLDCHYIIWLTIKYWSYSLLLFYIHITNKL